MTADKAHILLVDDDPSLLKLLSLRLESGGYQVTCAHDGRSALECLKRYPPDLVISDLRMDEMDVMDLFGHIQQANPGLPVIIITAHGSIPEAVSATRQGVFGFCPNRSRSKSCSVSSKKPYRKALPNAMIPGAKRSLPIAPKWSRFWSKLAESRYLMSAFW